MQKALKESGRCTALQQGWYCFEKCIRASFCMFCHHLSVMSELADLETTVLTAQGNI